MSQLFLIYVNHVGKDYKGNYIYEFIFSDTTKDIDGEDWDKYPASGRPEPPYSIFIKKVGRLESEIKFDVLQNSDSFALWDGIDGVIALAWEDVNNYETYPDRRMNFKFGDTLENVESTLYEKDLILDYKKNLHEKEN